MQISAGLVIIQNNKILLGHPTNAQWKHSYSFPKGGLEVGENNIEAALRETKEEVGLDIPINIIGRKNEYLIEYKNKLGKLYKKVFYYVIYLDNDTYSEVLDSKTLQISEIDWAGFLTKEEAEEKIFWRFKDILRFLKYKHKYIWKLKTKDISLLLNLIIN